MLFNFVFGILGLQMNVQVNSLWKRQQQRKALCVEEVQTSSHLHVTLRSRRDMNNIWKLQRTERKVS